MQLASGDREPCGGACLVSLFIGLGALPKASAASSSGSRSTAGTSDRRSGRCDRSGRIGGKPVRIRGEQLVVSRRGLAQVGQLLVQLPDIAVEDGAEV
jgi:hypothetical protein